jgi:hypothetical protein
VADGRGRLIFHVRMDAKRRALDALSHEGSGRFNAVLARNFTSVIRRSAQEGPSLTEGREVILMLNPAQASLAVRKRQYTQ